MTLTITVPDEIGTEVENLPESDRQRIDQIAASAVADALQKPSEAVLAALAEPQLNLEEWNALVDEFVEMLPATPILSDYAMSREGIYEDHS